MDKNDIQQKLMLRTFMIWLIKKLKANLGLIIQQVNQLKCIKKHRSELINGEKFVHVCS